jgi:prepilin-type N-terminal cleavage/methylation domain-containing protein
MNRNMQRSRSQHGFTLIELMVATALGVMVILGMLSLFRLGVNTAITVTQRADTQQNMRAGIEMMAKDIALAGAGLPTGGLQLPTGGTLSKVGCNQAGTCYLPTDTYPTGNIMYGILPGFDNGVQSSAVIADAPAATNDSITTIYCDYNFQLSNFTFSFPTGYSATVTLNASPTAGLPTNILAPGGLNQGDLIFFQVTSPGTGTGNQGSSSSQTASVVAEISAPPSGSGSGGPWTLDFAAGDALNFNQSGPNSLDATVTALGASLGYTGTSSGNQVTACRLEAVTYFLQVPPAGGTVQTPRLMRQVNGLTAIPLADNIINLQFSYDLISSSTGLINANIANPIAAGDSPAMIQKINMLIMGQSILGYGTKNQSMFLATSVSARNMSFCNSYSYTTTACSN